MDINENKDINKNELDNTEIKKENKKQKPKKEKKHRVRKFFVRFSIFILILGGAVGGLTYALYDDDHSTFEGDPNFEMGEEMNYALANSLTNIREDGKINFVIKEDNINNMLKGVSNSLPASVSPYIKNFYLDIKEDNYLICVDLEAFFLKSKVVLDTKLVENEEGVFEFSIVDVKLGKIGGLRDIIVKVTNGIINDQTIESLFQGIGLEVKCDLANYCISYESKLAINDLEKLVLGNESSSMYMPLIKDFHDLDLVTFDFNNNNSITVTADLSSLQSNANFETEDKELNATKTEKLDEYASQTKHLLKEGLITPEQANSTFYYLLRGYDSCRKLHKDISFLAEVDLSSCAISDYTLYQGANIEPSQSIETLVEDKVTTLVEDTIDDHTTAGEVYFKDQIKAQVDTFMATWDPLDPQPTASDIALDIQPYEIGQVSFALSEDEINTYLSNIDLVGETTVLASSLKDEYLLNYITYSNLYVNIIENGFIFVITININGFDLTMAMETELVPSSDSGSSSIGINLQIKNVYLGEKKIGNEIEKMIFTLLESSFSRSGLGDFDIETKTFNIKFENDFDTITSKVIDDFVINLSGTSIEDAGALNIEGNAAIGTEDLEMAQDTLIDDYIAEYIASL